MALAKTIVLLLCLRLCLIGTAGGALGRLCIPPPRSAARPPRLATNAITPTTPRPSLDWRARGAVTPVIFQGQIGSCWAISSVGAIKGLHKIQTGRLVRLSSQQIFDCSNKSMADSDLKAFDWVVRNGGVASEETYLYVGRVQDCKREKLHLISASIRSYKMDIRDELDLLAADSYKPVSVRMWLDPPSFYNYTGGIFTGSCGKEAHGMLLSRAAPLLASPSPLLPCRCSRSAPPRLLSRACPSPRRLALALPPVLASFAAASYSCSSAALLVVASPLLSIADPPPFAGAVRGRLVVAALRRATRPRPDFARSGVAPASARTLTGLRPLPASARAR
ncbi:cathepsin S-like [Triticum aestivum]|uniref:cathepsin S-like n=1 Tax=Triticum aestivum TaxID=4565 RepID=UPI001D02E2E6|nr:cathepsin S-like [Triticum aestivum]